MRLLGIDYGSRNIGLSLSDEEKKMAFPYKTIENKSGNYVAEELRKIIKKELVSEIVIGLPLSFSGEENSQSRICRRFAEKVLGRLKLPVHFQNEILSSQAAKVGAAQGKLDTSAAALILQDYLDKINPKHEARNPKQIQNNKL